MQIERHDPSPEKVLRRSWLYTIGGLLIAAAFGLGLPLALLLCGGCYGVAVSGKGGVQLDASQIAAFKDIDPKTAAAILDAMNAQVGVAGLDSVEKVERTWNLSRDPKTGAVSIGVTANHSGDAEAIRAVGQQLQALTQTIAPVVQALGQAKIAAGVVAPLLPLIPPIP